MRFKFDLYGYTQRQIVFTDNMTKAFLQSVLPSLLQDIVPVTEEDPHESLNSFDTHCLLFQEPLKSSIFLGL